MFYVSPFGLISCLCIFLLIYMWGNFLLSRNIEITINNKYLTIKDGKKVTPIELKNIKGLYFHDETKINQSDITKK